MCSHKASCIHTEVAERGIDPKNMTKDCMSAGTQTLKERRLKEYAAQRDIFLVIYQAKTHTAAMMRSRRKQSKYEATIR